MGKIKNLVKYIVTVQCKDEEEKIRIGSQIHRQLIYNLDYIESRIDLDISEPNEVNLYIYDICGELPEITLFKKES